MTKVILRGNSFSNYCPIWLKYFFILEFLGRTEIRISDLLTEKSRKDSTAGPLTKKLQLYEAESGIVTVRLDLQLF